MPAPETTVQLLAREPLSPRVHRLRFRALSPFRWQAGQYLTVVRGAEQDLFLPYSIASAYDPDRPDELEIAAAFRAGADVIDELALGAELQIVGPAGELTWQAQPSPSALLIGVGTGVAPLRALAEEELARDSEVRLLLLAGQRAAEDLLFSADFARLAATHARFRFQPTLTLAAETWTGERGRVQSQLSQAVRSLGLLDAYVCGRVDMTSDVVQALEGLGVPRARIRSEGY